MYTLGSSFIPSANHAGGLRYHGMSTTLSQLYHDGYMEATSVEQTKVFEAAEVFARVEGILPAPESSHAIRVAIDEALKCKETGEEKTILFGLTGAPAISISMPTRSSTTADERLYPHRRGYRRRPGETSQGRVRLFSISRHKPGARCLLTAGPI